MAEWLRDRRHPTFAIRVLERIGSEPAHRSAAVSVLSAVDRAGLAEHLNGDLERTLALLGHTMRLPRGSGVDRAPRASSSAERHRAGWTEREYETLFGRFPPEGPRPTRSAAEQLASELGRTVEAVEWQWQDAAEFVRGGTAKTTSQQLMAWLDAESVEITDPMILVRINRLYRPDMSPTELYDTTRRSWLVGERREGARYALALYTGRVLESYQIDGWVKAVEPGRWEFIGRVADDPIRDRYVGRTVKSYLVAGNQHPIVYVGC